MPWGEIGGVLLLLAAAAVAGNLWFHLVESVLRGVRKLFDRGKEPPVWHPLPPEKEEKNDV